MTLDCSGNDKSSLLIELNIRKKESNVKQKGRIRAFSATGSILEDDGIAIAQGVSGVMIKGFEIRDYLSSVSNAITADGASHIKIINNMIYNVFSGIYIGNGKNVEISKNVVKDSDFVGIWIAADITDSENIKVMNNRVTGITTPYPEFGGHGIYVIVGEMELKNLKGSENNRVIGNRVRKNREWGIALVEDMYGIPSNNNVVASNIAKGNVLYDLYDDRTGTGNIWRSNIYKTKNW